MAHLEKVSNGSLMDLMAIYHGTKSKITLHKSKKWIPQITTYSKGLTFSRPNYFLTIHSSQVKTG